LWLTLVCLSSSDVRAQWLAQQVTLQPGWNAVHLHIEPYPASLDAQFAGTPVVAVHRYYQRPRIAQFERDAAHPFPRPAEWLTWRPDDGTNRFVRTLETLSGDTAYLIRATNAAVLSLVGQPVLLRREWVPRIPNLAGFPIDPTPGAQPTFAAFFASEPRIPVVGGPTDGLVHEIDTELNAIDLSSRSRRQPMAPGRAYWFRPTAHTRFTGPVEVSASHPLGLFFSEGVHQLSLHIRNASGKPLPVVLRHVTSATPPPGTSPRIGAVPLLRTQGSPTEHVAWPADDLVTRTLAPDETWTVPVAVDRTAMVSGPSAASTVPGTRGTWQSLIRVKAGGVQLHVPVAASAGDPAQQTALYPAGLWLGEAQITMVSYLAVTATNETPGEVDTGMAEVSRAFPVRLILHQGADNICRLLSDVLVTASGDVSGSGSNRLFSLYAGPARSADVEYSALARLSSPALGGAGVVPLTNAPQGGFLRGPLQGQFTIAADHPLNPFRHLYHSQHTNGIALTNTVMLSNWSSPGGGTNRSATLWNPEEIVTGILLQTIEGLRHEPIRLTGAFRLKRVSTVSTLEGLP
jgi:hypothetical protein